MTLVYWEHVQAIAKSLGLLGRVKEIGRDLESVWQPLWVPTPGYLETGRSGPVSVKEIEWVDLLVEVTTHRGRLVAPLVENKTDSLVAALSAAGASYELGSSWVRVQPPNNSFKGKPLRGSP